MWIQIEPSDSRFHEYTDAIDGFDYNHSIWVMVSEEDDRDYVMIYHNEDEPEGSPYYYGVYTTDGDGYCDGNLEEVKVVAELMMP